jgi:hypothetical protein
MGSFARVASKGGLRGTDTNSLLRAYDAAAATPGNESKAQREIRERTLERVRGELQRRGVRC